MTYRLDEFGIDGMLVCTAALRTMGSGATTVQDAADDMVRYLRAVLVDGDGRPVCALVRLYKTHALAGLPADLQEFAAATTGKALAPDTRVLTLIASAGDEAEWNDVTQSKGHRAIALPDADAVERYPMIAQLIAQLGIEVAAVVAPSAGLLVAADRTEYNVFHVEQAAGSASIPAQDFVEAYGIRSAVGFGGLLPRGDMYAVVMFSRVPVGRLSAQLFRSIAIGVSLPLISTGSLPLFRGGGGG